MRPEAKKLNEMNRLSDLGHFPAIVNLGASVNIVFTLAATWWIQPRYPQLFAPLLWVALVLVLNLLPVVLLRLTLTPDTVYPPLGQMDFVHDQHKFSDWVYLAASANMAFWILAGWSVFSISHSVTTLVATLLVAFLATSARHRPAVQVARNRRLTSAVSIARAPRISITRESNEKRRYRHRRAGMDGR